MNYTKYKQELLINAEKEQQEKTNKEYLDSLRAMGIMVFVESGKNEAHNGFIDRDLIKGNIKPLPKKEVLK